MEVIESFPAFWLLYKTEIILFSIVFITFAAIVIFSRRKASAYTGSTGEDVNPLDIMLTDAKESEGTKVPAEKYNHLRALAFTLVNKVDELDDTPNEFRCKSIGEAINRMERLTNTSITSHEAALSAAPLGLEAWHRGHRAYGVARPSSRMHHLFAGTHDLLQRMVGQHKILAYRGDTREQLGMDTEKFSAERDRLITHSRTRITTLTDMIIEQHEIHRAQMKDVLNSVKGIFDMMPTNIKMNDPERASAVKRFMDFMLENKEDLPVYMGEYINTWLQENQLILQK